MGEGFRVLHAPTDIAGQLSTLVRALRRMGYAADGLTFEPHPFRYGDLPAVFASGPRNRFLRLARKVGTTLWAAARYDVFHFHAAETLLPLNLDAPALRLLGKPVVLQFWGSEVRFADAARVANPWVAQYLSPVYDGRNRRRLLRLAPWSSVALVGDHELRGYVDGMFRRVEVLPQAIDLEGYAPRPPDPATRHPVVVHAPSNTNIKGTEHVIRAVERARQSRDFEFSLIAGKSHDEAVAALARADVLVDQLLVGTHGILALEAMALAKPVICYIREDLRATYPPDLPVVTATPDTLDRVLESLLADGELRHRLGAEGRRYVERHHDANEVATRLAKVYEALLA